MLFDARRALPQAKQDLLAVADYIREHGWCQGALRRSNGKVCIIGALQMLKKDMKVVEDILYENIEDGVITWNDSPGRTQEEVIAKLEEIAWSE